MNEYINELFAHQRWADAEQWRAFEAHPAALADKALLDRLLHIHLVQHAFLWVVSPRASQFEFKKLEDFPIASEMKKYAQQGHAEFEDLLKSVSTESLEEIIEVPWFQPPAKISRRHALTQAAMHSHYHRGQNATRLRELGGVPPTTDFIVWLKNGKPIAQWD